MSEIKKESLISLLSPEREGMKLVNVKFFRGDREMIRPEDLRAQLRAISAQHKAGAVAATGMPKSTQPKVDVRDFVANI